MKSFMGFRKPLFFVVLVAVHFPTFAVAQNVQLALPSSFQTAPTLEFDSFIAGISAGFDLTQTSNLKSDPSQQSGQLATARFVGFAASTWDQHEFSANVAVMKMEAISDRAVDNHLVSYGLNGRYDLDSGWSLDASGSVNETIVDTTNPDQLIGNVNGISRVSAIAVGTNRNSGTGNFRLVARHQNTESKTAISTADVNQISFSDRTENALVTEYTWNVGGNTRFVNAGFVDIRYPNASFDRDSQGVLLGAGFTQTDGTAQYSAWLAGIYQEFDSASIGTHAGVIGNIGVVKQLTDRTTLGVNLARVFDDQNVGPTSAGVFQTNLSVAAQHEISDHLYVRGDLTRGIFELQNVGTATETRSFTGRIAWRVNESLIIPLDIMLTQQDARSSAFSALNFDTYKVTLGATYNF
jgi:hypothetical protein